MPHSLPISVLAALVAGLLGVVPGSDLDNARNPSRALLVVSRNEQTIAIGYRQRLWNFYRPVVSPWAYQAKGNVYWVAMNGHDQNAGTAQAPFKTINRAVTRARPGDIVYVRAGTYVENLTITQSGLAGKPIIISCAPRNLGKVRITPSKEYVQANPGGAVITVNGPHHVWINGFVIEGPKGQPYAPPVGFIGQANGISWAGGGGYGCRATNNVIYANMHCGLKELSHGGNNIVMEGNVVFDNGTTTFDHGIYCPADNCTIDGNIVFNNASWGIHAYSHPQRLLLYFNICVGNANGGLLLAGSSSAVYNNVFAYNGGYGILYYTRTCTGNFVKNNICAFNTIDGGFGDGGPDLGAPINNLDDFNLYFPGTADALIPPGADEIYSDPQFTNAALGDFRPAAGSPAIGSGTAVGLPFQGHRPNVGAF